MSSSYFSLVACAALTFAVCSASIGQRPAQEDATLAGPVHARFAFRPEDELVILPVTFKGKEISFSLVTGSTHTFFDLSLLLGEPFKTTSLNGAWTTHDVRTYARPEASLGPIPLTGNERIVGIDLHNQRMSTGQNLMGIVGFDALKDRVVRIDFDRGQVLFLAAVGSDSGQPFPMIVEKGLPYIMARVNGHEHRFMIETGDSGSLTGELATPLFEELSENGEIFDHDEVTSESLFNTFSSGIGRVKELAVGEFKVSFPYFSESRRNKLGFGFWTRFVVTFDLRSENKRVYLKPGKQYSLPDLLDRSGMQVSLYAGKIKVKHVTSGGPSDKSGIQEGDELWMIGTKRAVDLGLGPIRRALSAAGTTLPIVIRRDGKEIAVSVALSDERSGCDGVSATALWGR
jgi:hypothetical protein